jgi:thiamine-phosphate pyrophosphorylase
MRLHAVVSDLDTASRAVDGGATVLQLRLKGLPTGEVVAQGAPFRDLARAAGIAFVVNDDLDAALQLEADGVHLGREDEGARDALAAGVLVGLSASSVGEAEAAQRAGAGYIGAGPIWETPTKPDAGPPLGLEGLRAVAGAVTIPVVAIGGVDAENAASCIAAGAAGVAVVRAAADAGALRKVVDAALAAR